MCVCVWYILNYALCFVIINLMQYACRDCIFVWHWCSSLLLLMSLSVIVGVWLPVLLN